MRKTALLLAASLCLSFGAASARPLDVHVHVRRGLHGPHAQIASYLVRHGLLTTEQAACASLVPAPHGSYRVTHLSVFEHSGGRCPGEPQPPQHLFDVYVDTVSGVVDTTRDEPDELDTVL